MVRSYEYEDAERELEELRDIASKYDDMEIMKLYKTIVKNNKGQPLDKIVDDFLSQTYNSIERNR